MRQVILMLKVLKNTFRITNFEIIKYISKKRFFEKKWLMAHDRN